jgi:hypothetical protein
MATVAARLIGDAAGVMALFLMFMARSPIR